MKNSWKKRKLVLNHRILKADEFGIKKGNNEFDTVNPCAISSSGTNSGLNKAGVIQGHRVFIGSSVTMTSPLANPSRTRPDDNSIVRNPCSFGVGAGDDVENDVVTDLFRWFFASISMTAGLDWATCFCACEDGVFLILI